MKRSVFAIAAVIGFNGLLNIACSEAQSTQAAASISAKTDDKFQSETPKSQAEINSVKPDAAKPRINEPADKQVQTDVSSRETPPTEDVQSQPTQPAVDQPPLPPKTVPVKHLIEIKKFKFSIPKLDVKVGDEVTWINLDIVPHTATALDKSWDSGELKKGESYTMVITDNISLAYFCLYHRQMKAEFVMKDES